MSKNQHTLARISMKPDGKLLFYVKHFLPLMMHISWRSYYEQGLHKC